MREMQQKGKSCGAAAQSPENHHGKTFNLTVYCLNYHGAIVSASGSASPSEGESPDAVTTSSSRFGLARDRAGGDGDRDDDDAGEDTCPSTPPCFSSADNGCAGGNPCPNRMVACFFVMGGDIIVPASGVRRASGSSDRGFTPLGDAGGSGSNGGRGGKGSEAAAAVSSSSGRNAATARSASSLPLSASAA